MKAIRDKWSRQKQPSLHSISSASATRLSETTAETSQILEEFSKTFLSLNENIERDAYASDDSTSRSDPKVDDDQQGQLVGIQQGLRDYTAVSTADNNLTQSRQVTQSFSVWLCQVCGSIQSSNPSLSTTGNLGLIKRSVTFEALQSARNQCSLCHVIVEAILAFGKQNITYEEPAQYVKIDCWLGHHCKLMVEGPYQHRRGLSLSIYSQEGIMDYSLTFMSGGVMANMHAKTKFLDCHIFHTDVKLFWTCD